MILKKVRTHNTFFFLLSIFCLLSLLIAFVLEIFFHVLPCPLCIYQRYIMFSMGVLSFLTLRFNSLNMISSIFIVISLSLNTYQIGVEQRWWEQPDSCRQKVVSMSDLKKMDDFEKKAALKKMKVVPCNIISWRFLGLPMTIWLEMCLLFFLLYRFSLKSKQHA